MSLGSLYREVVRKYKEDGFSSLISSGHYRAVAKLAQHSPTFAGISTPKLTAVAVEPTNVCNLRCRMCYSQSSALQPPRQRGFMELETYKRIIDELTLYARVRHKLYLCLGFGGEPLLHRNFLEMVDYAASKGLFWIEFYTNGMLLDDNLIKALINLEISQINVSLDGLGKINDSIRVGADYEVVRRNILNLVKERGHRSRPKIELGLTWSTQSEKDIQDFVKVWTGIVDGIIVECASSEDLRLVKPTLYDGALARTKRVKVCPYPFYYLAVLWNGDVVPCCQDLSGLNVLGNVSEDTIASIWNGKPYRALRRFAAGDRFPQQSRCHTCNLEKINFVPFSRNLGEFTVSYNGRVKIYQSLV